LGNRLPDLVSAHGDRVTTAYACGFLTWSTEQARLRN
jgi:hypothetical protein